MKFTIRNLFPSLTALALLIALMTGCTDKGTGNDLAVGGNVELRARVTSSAGVEEINQFILTVSARDMDTVVDTLEFADGEIIGEIEVPVGTDRKFVLEAWDQPAVGGPPILIYRGVTITDVLPGQVLRLVIDMEPLVPMMRLSPRYREMESGSLLEIDIEVGNIPSLAGINVVLDFSKLYYDMNPIRVERHASQSSRVITLGQLENDGLQYRVIAVDSAHRSMVNSEGDGLLATVTFSTRGFVGDELVIGEIYIIEMAMADVSQDSIPTMDILTDYTELVLTSQVDRIINFPDSVLEEAVMRNTEISAPPIYFSDVQYLEYLDVVEAGVQDWTGLGELINLQFLYLDWNDAPDLTPLAPLVGLTEIHAQGNEVTNIAPLANLIGLISLDLYWNQIANIAPLSELMGLRSLNLASNMVSDLSPLADLIYLENLELQNNVISDIQPLVDNPGLGDGDTIDLSGNPLDDALQQELIDALRQRGVTVYYGT